MATNALQPILEKLVGVYDYHLYPVYGGLACLDYAYLFRCVVLLTSLIMVFSLLNKIIIRFFGVIK